MEEQPIYQLPQVIDLSQYPDLYYQQNLIVFTRDLATKTNEIIEHLMHSRLNQKNYPKIEELDDQKLEDATVKISKGVLNRSRNQRLLRNSFNMLKEITQKKRRIFKTLTDLPMLVKRQFFRRLKDSALKETLFSSTLNPTSDHLHERRDSRKSKKTQEQANSTLNFNSIIPAHSKKNSNFDTAVIKLQSSVNQIKKDQTNMQIDLEQMKKQLKVQSVYTKLQANQGTQNQDTLFLQSLFEDLRDITDTSLHEVSKRFDEQISKVLEIINKNKTELEAEIKDNQQRVLMTLHDLRMRELENMKSDMKTMFQKLTHSGESFLQIRKEVSSLKDELKNQQNLFGQQPRVVQLNDQITTINQTTSRQHLQEQYETFVTQQLQQPQITNQHMLTLYNKQNGIKEYSQNYLVKGHQNQNIMSYDNSLETLNNRGTINTSSLEASRKRPYTSKTAKKQILLQSQQYQTGLQKTQRAKQPNDLKTLLSSNQMKIISKKASRNAILSDSVDQQQLVLAIENNKIDDQNNQQHPLRNFKGLEKLNKAIQNKQLPEQNMRSQTIDQKELNLNNHFRKSMTNDFISQNKKTSNSRFAVKPSNPYQKKYDTSKLNKTMIFDERLGEQKLKELLNPSLTQSIQTRISSSNGVRPLSNPKSKLKRSIEFGVQHNSHHIKGHQIPTCELTESHYLLNTDHLHN